MKNIRRDFFDSSHTFKVKQPKYWNEKKVIYDIYAESKN